MTQTTRSLAASPRNSTSRPCPRPAASCRNCCCRLSTLGRSCHRLDIHLPAQMARRCDSLCGTVAQAGGAKGAHRIVLRVEESILIPGVVATLVEFVVRAPWRVKEHITMRNIGNYQQCNELCAQRGEHEHRRCRQLTTLRHTRRRRAWSDPLVHTRGWGGDCLVSSFWVIGWGFGGNALLSTRPTTVLG